MATTKRDSTTSAKTTNRSSESGQLHVMTKVNRPRATWNERGVQPKGSPGPMPKKTGSPIVIKPTGSATTVSKKSN